MIKFHRRCGDRVTLLNHNLTAIRNFVEFNHGLILGAEPLVDDVMFEVKIDRKVNVWNGSLEIGVTTLDPEFMELPATATKLRNTAWILSGNSIVKDCVTLVNDYGPELDSLREGDCVGVTRSSKGELMFFINGRCLGVAAKDIPQRVFAVIDLYGQCVQVSIMQNNYSTVTRPDIDTMNEIEEYIEAEDERGQGEAAAWADPKTVRDTHIQMPIVCPLVSQDHIRFHPRCGILVKLSSNNKSAERARPLDDYNNGVVMTHRPLYDNELFEIRIDRLVDKWSGSIEVGVTTHNPATIRFPSTMTNMDSGTIMMSGCKVLLNGHGSCMEYGNFNLDELREGDTVGMMRKSTGKLHYFINGIDQGVATDKVAPQVWGVIDLYGMTVKVTIVDPCEGLDSNINHLPIRAVRAPQLPIINPYRPALDEETLLFHTLRDSNVIIINDGKTAHRPNAFEFFNNGIVMTSRTLKTNELFQVRLDLIIPKWAGSIEIGVTQHSSKDIKIPFKMSNEKSGTWAITGEDVIRDGAIIIPQYVRNLNKLVEGDTVGVMRKDLGILHFFVNGIDQGPAAFNIPEHIFGIIDLYGRVAQATIVDMYMPPTSLSPESPISSESNATVYPEMCFHRVHGRNARLSRHRLTASRATVYSEFNDAVLFSSRPLRECDMFEIRIEKMVDCWIGSLEIGVTAIRPDDLEASGGVGAIAGTATDLSWDTYILSGAAMMKDGECVRSGYPLDLDTLTEGTRVGVMWHADRSLHYYLDGMDMGKAWYVPHLNIYAVVDLYGQCAQVSIVQSGDRNYNYNGCNGEQYLLNRRRGYVTPPPPYWTFSEYCGENVALRNEYNIAQRMNPDPLGAIVFSSHHLMVDEIYEIQIHECKYNYAGSFRMGVTDVNILNANVNRHFPLTISWLPHFTAYIDGRYIRYSKQGTRNQEVRSFVPSFEWLRPGDRVGFKRTTDSRVLIYYNSELLDTAFEKVPDKVYVTCELGGHVTIIKSVTRGTPVVQPNQVTIKNDSGTMQQAQSTTSSDANATDNATGQSVVTANTAANAPAGADPSDGAVRPGTAQHVDPEAPIENVTDAQVKLGAGSSGRLGPGHFFDSGLPANVEEYLPNAPAMAAVEMPPTPEPSEIEPSCDENNAETIIASNEVEPEAGPSNGDPDITGDRRQHRSLPYTFHYMHGRNVRLRSSDTVAMRYRGHADGIAIASQPLRRGNYFRFRVDRVTHQWQGTLCIGAVATLPNEDVLPRSALNIEAPAWVITHDMLMNRGKYFITDQGRQLDTITVNTVLTLHFRFNSELVLEIDGETRGVIGIVPRVFRDIYPTIDLYGRVVQVSILLHPHVVIGGNSLDLPSIEENHHEDKLDPPDDDDYGGDDDDDDYVDTTVNHGQGRLWSNWCSKNRDRNLQNGPKQTPASNVPGPSRRPDCLPGINANDARNHKIKIKETLDQPSFHHSLILPNGVEITASDNDEAAKQIFALRRSLSTEQFFRPPTESEVYDEDDDSRNSLVNALSLGSRMGDDDDTLDVPEICDTNIRHNDRYPEASDVDLLDNEIMDALTLDAGNMPDLTEDQSPSIDESTRRDELWSDGILHIETLRYLNNIIRYSPDENGTRFADRDWVFYSETNGNCEHMHLALKFWNYLVLPYPDMREVVASGQVRCFCNDCQPDAVSPYAGWVRIERGACEASRGEHVFWHVMRSTLVSAATQTAESGAARRPAALAETPATNPSAADIWFDEEGKPHHTVLALDIDSAPGTEPTNDRLLAYMIYLRSHMTFNEEHADPLSFED